MALEVVHYKQHDRYNGLGGVTHWVWEDKCW